MNTVIYILFALSILNFVMLIACVLRFKDDFGIFDSVTKAQAQIYKESLQESFENYKKLIDVVGTMNSMVDLMSSQYKDIYEMSKHEQASYQQILDAYRKMYDLHKSLLEVVKAMGQQFNVTCEQFEEIGKGQADIYAKLLETYDLVKPVDIDPWDLEDDDSLWEPLSDEEDETQEDANDD